MKYEFELNNKFEEIADSIGLSVHLGGIILTKNVPADWALNAFAEAIIKDVIKSVDNYDFKIDPDDLICELKQRYLQDKL